MKLLIIIEKGDGVLWGRIENKGEFLPVTTGKNTKEIIKNMSDLITGYQQHEGRNDAAWKKVDVKKVQWELRYDVQAFFMEHDYLTASVIAKRAGINPGLIRQYSTGVKHPYALQEKKIEAAILAVAKELKAVSLCAA